MPYKLILFLFTIIISYSFTVMEVPERKIAREVENALNITDFELEIQEELSLKCIGREQYSKQIDIVNQEEHLGNVFIRRVHTCDPNACDDPTTTATENPEELEYFDYFIIIDKDSVIQNITVFEYQATHGQEVAKRNWISQFIEKQNEPLVYEGNIDGISGATVSAQNFTYEIEYLIDCYRGKEY